VVAEVVRTEAPAKINWTLEVLGRRDDGYHEVRSVMQTVTLSDTLTFREAERVTLDVEGPHAAGEDDLVLAAARAMRGLAARDTGVGVRLTKRIPPGTGLGGGSSDAAATLRALAALWELDLPREAVLEQAARIGSDAPFFVYGGTAVAAGRGELVRPLPDVRQTWLVLVVPPVRMTDKTRRMYGALDSADFTDGSRTEALARALQTAGAVGEHALFNVFERAAFETFEGLDAFRRAMLDAGARGVHVAGAGPALFCLTAGEREARAISRRLIAGGCDAYAVRTMTAAEATRVWRRPEAPG
jgi:4-diphosphocytidyl-2-C-methyl-D-erythritol kinase